MSQYVRINCKVLDDVKGSLLNKAIANMGDGLSIVPASNAKVAPNTYIKDAEGVLFQNGNQLTVGFKIERENKKNSLLVVGDFYYTKYDAHEFTDLLCKNYQLAKLQAMQKEKHMTLVNRTVEEDGTIRMRFAV